jgi:hypothetical protein
MRIPYPDTSKSLDWKNPWAERRMANLFMFSERNVNGRREQSLCANYGMANEADYAREKARMVALHLFSGDYLVSGAAQ